MTEPVCYTFMIAGNAPERLLGSLITATVFESKLEFSIEMPSDPTAQEIGYVRWSVAEFVDDLKRRNPVLSDMINSEQKVEIDGIVVQDERPCWPNRSGGPWAKGLTADGRICWA